MRLTRAIVAAKLSYPRLGGSAWRVWVPDLLRQGRVVQQGYSGGGRSAQLCEDATASRTGREAASARVPRYLMQAASAPEETRLRRVPGVPIYGREFLRRFRVRTCAA